VKTFLKLCACLLLLPALAWTDSLTLRDGRQLQGKYAGGNSNVIAFAVNGNIQYFPVSEVRVVIFGDSDVGSPLNGFQQNSLHGRSRAPLRRKIRSSPAVPRDPAAARLSN